jgi:hypothetical protein
VGDRDDEAAREGDRQQQTDHQRSLTYGPTSPGGRGIFLGDRHLEARRE